MNLSQRSLKPLFFAGLAFTLFSPLYIPYIKLLWFAPFLCVLFYQKPILDCFWMALGCGVIVDLTTSTHHFGLHALNYVAVSGLLYAQKRHFFGDSLSTLPIMTYLFSVSSTILQMIFLNLFEDVNILSFGWILRDLALMPLADSAYAFVLFVIPWRLYGGKPRAGGEYFTS